MRPHPISLLRSLGVLGVFSLAGLAASSIARAEALDSATCAELRALSIDRQASPLAARLAAACIDRPDAPMVTPLRAPSGVPPAFGGSGFDGVDLNLITGTEAAPAVTQAGSAVAGHGSEIVAVFNDTRDAPTSYSGISVSVDGGINFARLEPNPFVAAFAGDAGSPAVAWDEMGATWVVVTLAASCGGQGIGVMTSSDPSNSASWAAQPCAHSGTADDRPLLWIDNNAASPNFGRRYIAFNDFAASGALKVVYTDAGSWNEVVVSPTFVRNVNLTGSPGSDGTIFVFGMNEGGGAGAARINVIFRSLTGGTTWTSVQPGPSYPAVGAGLCAASDYFYMVPPVWRTMGWGQGAVGPGGVVHYVWARAGQVPGDLGDIYYIRSIDNGASWSAPAPLNTDQAAQNNVVQWQPSITVTSEGYVLATWYDRRNTTDGLEYQIYGRLSLNNGASFLPDAPLSDVVIPQPTQVDPALPSCFAGDSNLTSTIGNAALVTWTDGRNAVDDQAQMDVYFRRTPLCPPIAIAPVALADGEVGAAYLQTVSASGGTAPYTYVASGALPDGLLLDSGTGDLAGAPTVAGISLFSVVATDAQGCSGTRPYGIVVEPPACPAITISPATLPGVTQGAPYLQTLVASGGAGGYTYAVTAGELPEGIVLDPSTGVLSGAAVESGTYDFEITAVDSGSCAGSRAYSIVVGCPTVTLGPASQLPDAFAGVPYLTNIVANGGTAPYTYEITEGTLHNGIYMGEGGTVFGVTEGPGTKIFRVTAVDANGCSGVRQFRMDSKTCFDGSILCDAMGDLAVNFTAADVCGGAAEWHGTSACPSSNDVGHTPSAVGRWGTLGNCFDYGTAPSQDVLETFPLDVSNCNSGEVLLRFNYLLGFGDTADSDRARVEVVVDGGAPQVLADNGPGGPTCSGAASPGLGNLRNWSGWQHLDLTVPATSTFQARFVGETDDASGNEGEGFMVDDVLVQCVCPDDYVVTPESLPQGVVNTSYSVTIAGVGGAPPYTYSTLPGSPTPAGLTLDPVTGQLFGIPTAPGLYSFTVVVVDSNFCKTSILYNLLISPESCPAIGLTPPPLPDAVEGTFYSTVITATGGTEPYDYQLTLGDLPPGLALDPASGVISGTPTTPEVYFFTVSVIDAAFCPASQDYSVIVTPQGCTAIDITPTALPNATRGVDYLQLLSASGGVAPYRWLVTGGALPLGMALIETTGELTGPPEQGGTFDFTVTAQDSLLCADSQLLSLEVIETMPFIDGFESGDTSAWSSTFP